MDDNGMEHMLGKHTGLVFYSDNVRGTCEELKAKGVTIAEEPRDEPWGVEAQFTDMDGNGFEIVGG